MRQLGLISVLLILFLLALSLMLLDKLIPPRLHLLCRTVKFLKRWLLLDLSTVDLGRTLANLRCGLLSSQPIGLFFPLLLFKLAVGLLFVLLVIVSLDKTIDLFICILSVSLI